MCGQNSHEITSTYTERKTTMSTEKVFIPSMYKVSATMKVSRLFAIAKLPIENKNVDI